MQWFIDFAYSFVGFESMLYFWLFLAVALLLLECVCEYEKKCDLEEKFEKYKKLQDFVEFIYSDDERDIEKDIDRYILDKEFKKRDEEYEKEINDIFKIF